MTVYIVLGIDYDITVTIGVYRHLKDAQAIAAGYEDDFNAVEIQKHSVSWGV